MRIALYLSGVMLWAVACTPSPYSSDPEVIARGKELFTIQCSACHPLQQDGIGPRLAGITASASPEWLAEFIRNPQALADKGDPRTLALIAQYRQAMPGFAHLHPDDIRAILAYLHTEKPQATAAAESDWGQPVARPQPDSVLAAEEILDLEVWARLPVSEGKNPLTRINLMRRGPGNEYFLHDLRGTMYRLSPEGKAQVYLDLKAQIPAFIDQPGLGTGFGAFAFHPDFEKNGLFYTSHTEKPGAQRADFPLPDSIPATLQWVVSEWKTGNPGAAKFEGIRREVLRVECVSGIHGMQELAFSPLAQPGDEDWGKLYIGIGDGGAAMERYVDLPGKKTSVWGAVLRIDPLGKNSANGRYGIPADNPFARAEAGGEVWAYGFRNPHRFSWDAPSGKMLIADVGQDQVEEINLGVAGGDFGWPRREGPYRLDPLADIAKVYPLAADDGGLGLYYPLAFYDHHTGKAVAGGAVYRGSRFPALQGWYLMGDIPTGQVLGFDFDEKMAGRPASIHRFQVAFEGRVVPFSTLVGNQRVDLHLAMDDAGHIFFLTKADGTVWRVKGVGKLIPN